MTKDISRRLLTARDVEKYEAMLKSDSGNLIYGALPFLSFIEQVAECRVGAIVAERAGTILGALPFAVSGRPETGLVFNSLPWWGSHGSIVLDRKSSDAAAIRTVLLQGLATEIARVGPLSATVILLPDEESAKDQYLGVFQPDVVEPRNGQMTQLPLNQEKLEDVLLASFGQKTRNLVRKSFKQGFVECVTDDDWAWDYLAETHAQNINALGGRAKPRAHFEALRSCIPGDMRRLALALDDGKPVAAMLTLAFNGTVEYLTPAISIEHRSRQPLSFLILNGMLAAVLDGNRIWNWGGTWITQTALHHFKAGFGGVDCAYSYLLKASPTGVAFFREHRADLDVLFPFFYTYPFGLLDDPA